MILDDLEDNYRLSSEYHRIVGLKHYVTEPAFIFKDFRCKGIKKGKNQVLGNICILFRTYLFYRDIS